MNAKEIFELNMKAIESLKWLESLDDETYAKTDTTQAQSDLACYSGFGGCSAAFYKNSITIDAPKVANKGWEDNAKRLLSALTEAEYSSIRNSVQNAFFTPSTITDNIYARLQKIGVSSPKLDIFEPGCGTGNFLSLMPDNFEFNSYTGIEFDSLTARMATQIYRLENNIDVIDGDFKKVPLEKKYDLIIGNPPFGDNKIDGQSIHNYFIDKSIKLLKPGGVLSMVITHSFLDAANQKTRDSIFQTANLLGVERLNQKAFAHTGTDVNTDIVYFQKLSNEHIKSRNAALEKSAEDRNLDEFDDLKLGDAWLPASKVGDIGKWGVKNFVGESIYKALDGFDFKNMSSVNIGAKDNVFPYVGDLERNLFIFDGVNNIVADRFGGLNLSTIDFKTSHGRVLQKSMSAEEFAKLDDKAKLKIVDKNVTKDMEFVNIKRENLLSGFDVKSFTVALDEQNLIKDKNVVENGILLFESDVRDGGLVDMKANYQHKFTMLNSGSFISGKSIVDKGLDADAIYILQRESNTVVEGNHQLIKESFFAVEYDLGGKTDTANKKALSILTGYTVLRDLTTSLLASESAGDGNDNDIRAELNIAYDNFVAEHGFINNSRNKRYYAEDPLIYRVLVLEEYDKGVTLAQSKKTGAPERPESAIKSKLFSENVLLPFELADMTGKPIEEILKYSFSIKGKIDIKFMAEVSDLEPKELSKYILDNGFGFIVEDYGDIIEKEIYLSGDLGEKVDTLKTEGVLESEMHDEYGNVIDLNSNLKALTSKLPDVIKIHDLSPSLGESWIPERIVSEFINEKIYNDKNISATYLPDLGKWVIGETSYIASNSTDFCTNRIDAINLIENILNHKAVVVKNNMGDGKYIVDEEATTLALENANKIRSEFENFILASPAIIAELETLYNNTFNRYVPPNFDVETLDLPGKVDDDIIELRPTQNSAISRIVKTNATLLDHSVGLGKTFTMVAAAMELRRLGNSKKPLFVVPNHIVVDFAKAFSQLYPNSVVMSPTKKNLLKENRLAFFEKVRVTDCDAVILGHSHFKFIDVSVEKKLEVFNEMLESVERSIYTMNSIDGIDRRTISVQEKSRANIIDKIDTLLANTGRKDNTILFEDMGFDSLFVDEAHMFKNLPLLTSMSRVAGLGSTGGSQMAIDLSLKVSILKSKGCKVCFATGTPISNSMAELHTMQKYLDPEGLRRMGVSHFDAWQSIFASVTSEWELAPTGMSYRLISRFSKFNKVPELMAMYRVFADVVTASDLKIAMEKTGKRIGIPTVNGGKPANIVINKNEKVAEYMVEIVERASNLPSDPSEDNMLKVMNDARKAALDFRLIEDGADIVEGYDESKVFEVADNVHDIYNVYDDVKGTQLVFIDLSTPKKAKNSAVLDSVTEDEILASVTNSDFNVYDELTSLLVAKGVPLEEIAYIHDANTDIRKDDLYKQMRSGKIRILLGSTAKMGTGMNVQDRLVALHHVDAPWRPADLNQREGRILRQGNLFYDNPQMSFQPHILRYAVEGSLDSRIWQILESKATFIEQFRAGNFSGRQMAEIASEAMPASEMKAAASGNPLVLEEINLKSEVDKLLRLQRSDKSMLASNNSDIVNFTKIVESSPEKIKSVEKIVKILAENKLILDEKVDALDKDGKKILLKTEGDTKEYKQIVKKSEQNIEVIDATGNVMVYKDYLTAATVIIDNVTKNPLGQADYPIFKYRGLEFEHTKDWTGRMIFLIRNIETDYTTEYNNLVNLVPSGFFTRINNFLNKFDNDRVVGMQGQLKMDSERLENLLSRKVMPIFTKEKEAELVDKQKRHNKVLIQLENEEKVDSEKVDYQPNLVFSHTVNGLNVNVKQDGSREYKKSVAKIFKKDGSWVLKDSTTSEEMLFECKYQVKLKAHNKYNPKFKDSSDIDFNLNDLDVSEHGVFEGDITEDLASESNSYEQVELVFVDMAHEPEKQIEVEKAGMGGWFA